MTEIGLLLMMFIILLMHLNFLLTTRALRKQLELQRSNLDKIYDQYKKISADYITLSKMFERQKKGGPPPGESK